MKSTPKTNRMPPPTPCSCASSAALIRHGRLVCAVCGAEPTMGNAATPRVSNAGLVADYSQIDPPAGVPKRSPKYFCVAHLLRAANDPECWKEGRAVLMTHAAWLRGLELLGQGRAAPKPPESRVVAVDADAEARELLGLEPRRTA